MMLDMSRKCELISSLSQLRSNVVVLLCIVLAILGVESTVAADLSLDNARIRLPLPGQTTAVVYFDLSNRSDSDRVLVGVHVGGAERAEMHQHQHVDGMMRMREVKTILVKAGTQIEFKPHGYHVMAFRFVASQKLSPGEQIEKLYPIELQFEDGTMVSAQAQPFLY